MRMMEMPRLSSLQQRPEPADANFFNISRILVRISSCQPKFYKPQSIWIGAMLSACCSAVDENTEVNSVSVATMTKTRSNR